MPITYQEDLSLYIPFQSRFVLTISVQRNRKVLCKYQVLFQKVIDEEIVSYAFLEIVIYVRQ